MFASVDFLTEKVAPDARNPHSAMGRILHIMNLKSIIASVVTSTMWPIFWISSPKVANTDLAFRFDMDEQLN